MWQKDAGSLCGRRTQEVCVAEGCRKSVWQKDEGRLCGRRTKEVCVAQTNGKSAWQDAGSLCGRRTRQVCMSHSSSAQTIFLPHFFPSHVLLLSVQWLTCCCVRRPISQRTVGPMHNSWGSLDDLPMKYSSPTSRLPDYWAPQPAVGRSSGCYGGQLPSVTFFLPADSLPCRSMPWGAASPGLQTVRHSRRDRYLVCSILQVTASFLNTLRNRCMHCP